MTSSVVKYSESRIKCSFLTISARLRVIRLPLCFFSKFCRFPFRLLYDVDLVFRSASIWPTCFEMMSAMLRNDCLIGYFAMSHWNRVRYAGRSSARRCRRVLMEIQEQGNPRPTYPATTTRERR